MLVHAKSNETRCNDSDLRRLQTLSEASYDEDL
jgi:hypothetical protein